MSATAEKVLSFRNLDGVKRTDIYTIDPKEIDCDILSHLNPRKDFGDAEFQELKESIRENGLKQAIKVTQIPKTNKIALTHGFRRMKAIMELINEGVEIEKVKADLGTFNEETIALEHISMNSAKDLTPIELAEGVYKYHMLRGGNNISDVAVKVGYSYSKVYNMIDFIDKASTNVKEQVRLGILPMTTAMALVKDSLGTINQNTRLEKALKDMANESRKKIKSTDLNVKTPNINKFTLFKTNLKTKFDEGKTTFTYDEVMSMVDELTKKKGN